MNLGWICGFFVGILGIISHFTYIHMASEYNYWLLVIGFFLVSLSGPRPLMTDWPSPASLICTEAWCCSRS